MVTVPELDASANGPSFNQLLALVFSWFPRTPASHFDDGSTQPNRANDPPTPPNRNRGFSRLPPTRCSQLVFASLLPGAFILF